MNCVPQVDSQPIRLPEFCPKASGLADRGVALAQTLALLPQLRTHYGITRIAETTYLDRTGIPTTSAIVPDSPDLLSVYSGKGATRESAMCSALMEAVERQCAAAPSLPIFETHVDVVMESLDLSVLGLLETAKGTCIQCAPGTNLLTGSMIAVPLAMIQCPWFGPKLFAMTSTNGLASGNTLTEAIYHALCEVIERHVWSMYHGRSHLVPRVFLGPQAADLGLAREVCFPTGNPAVDSLASKVQQAGLQLRALYLEEPPLPATMLATIFERDASPPMAHMGFGSSLSPAHALSRAITEAAQSRVVDIQAAREDVVRADAPKSKMADHGRRQTVAPHGRWYFDVPSQSIELAEITDSSSADLAVDLRRVLGSLSQYGAHCVAVVDLSPAGLPLNVVRVVVPELETMLVDGRVGPRMNDLLNPFKFGGTEVRHA
jgi:ribosomal protein S12 methylthiotransferase accessory factor